MRWKFVAQGACFVTIAAGKLLAEFLNIGDQHVDLLLLAINRAVKLVDHVFGVADLDFKIGDSGFHFFSLVDRKIAVRCASRYVKAFSGRKKSQRISLASFLRL